jgi:hypothetical protein
LPVLIGWNHAISTSWRQKEAASPWSFGLDFNDLEEFLMGISIVILIISEGQRIKWWE